MLLLIFDLDGTLIDSSRDLATSTNATREHFGLSPLAQTTINSYVGNGAAVLVRRAMGSEISDAQQAEALDYFLQYYRVHSLEHTRLYDGVSECLSRLASDGHQLGVLTNKPERISVDILGALGVHSYFFRVYGGNSLPEKKPDPIGLLRMMEESGAAPNRTMMIGDSSVDIQTARNAHVKSCGVTWGFQPETFRATPPDFVVDYPHQLLNVVSRLN